MNAQPAWGQEFSQRLQQQGVPQQQQQQQLQNNNYAAGMSGYMGYEKAFSSQLGMGMGQTMEPAQQQQTSAADFQFDESAFERAFEDAAKEAESFFYEPEPEIEPVVEEKQKQHEPFVKEGDDLARTAGALLDSVSEDTSTKFQNSNFLALMRKLRDREVVVEGDKMVEREG